MSLETASFVANLVITNPDGDDTVAAGDDHIRLLKAVLKRQFPLADSAWSISAAQVMYLGDLSASVQLQLNQLRDGSATANNALYANSASYAALAATANSASFALIAATANSASYAALAGTANYAQSAGFATTATTATNATNATTADTATNATNALFASQATYANTCTSASSAATLAGLSGVAEAGTASTVVLRNGAGDIFARYFNQSSGAESTSVGHVMCMTNLDGYLRVVSVSVVGPYLETINITSKTGTRKTLASDTGPPSLSGSTNGDLFYFW